MDDRSTDEILAEISSGIWAINTALIGDGDYPVTETVIPNTRLRYAAFKLRGEVVVEEIIAWVVVNDDSDTVQPVTPFRIVRGLFGYGDDPHEAEAYLGFRS